MWICLNNAFLSIVQPGSNDPNNKNGNDLLVRSRVRGHIDAVFPDANVLEVKGRDYQFRAYIARDIVSKTISNKLLEINYPNFKNSVKNHALHDAYACVWGVMAQEQEVPPYENAPRKRKRFPVNPSNPYASDGK